ncbi:carbohydrate ABC transporter permease [Escherichia coli]|uniref:carbohydrate ABC transporter permease n=6 Tax=Enterobacterales TaxID=91347 RepID=UPI001CDAEDAD|nr:carbohydrate ABC transporter permease [Escherichia coli]MCV4999019.1 carbohydrate ABC transporter permease [Escherichia coli]HCP8850912.1 carbohydrate ABC transporter permease [Escherichia coli]HDP6476568.1 carbohydrate ABC transporter permease [Escherichia coli]
MNRLFSGRSDMPFALLLLAPSLLLLGGLVAWPMVSNIEISFLRLPLNPNIESTFVGVSNYVRILSDPDFWHSLWMTVWYTALVVAGSTVLGLAVAMFFNREFRLRFKGRMTINASFYTVYMFSGILLVVPLFKIITALGIYDTEMALIITMVTQTLPTAVFMLKSYFDTIPDEIEEAAMMDGLNRLQIIFRITVPLAMSGLISVFVYCFMVAWNDYLFASIFLSSASNFTLPVGLNALFSTPDYIWGRMMAASLVTALPVVIMYALSERFIKSGLTAGGVKG